MLYRNIPFLIVLFSSVLPIFAALIDSKIITLAPDFLLLLVFLLLVFQSPKEIIYLEIGWFVVFSLLVFHILFGVFTGRGVASGGVVLLFVSSFLFYRLLEKGTTPYKIVSQISFIYLLHLGFIYIELGFIVTGNQGVLVTIFGNTTDVMRYKAYNSAPFLRFMGFDSVNGFNSLLLGSQSASQLVLFSVFWFSPIYRDINHVWRRSVSTVACIFAIAVFPAAVTMTAMLILALLILFVVYLLPVSRLGSLVSKSLFPILCIVFSGVLIPLFTYRIYGDAIDIYLTTFLAPVYKFLDLSLVEQVMGYGRNARAVGIEAADFGVGMITFKAGLYFLFLAVGSFLFLILLVLGAARKHNDSPWAVVSGVNIVCAIGWAIGLVHYTPSIELGGRHIFAFHIAVCLIALKRMRNGETERMRGLPKVVQGHEVGSDTLRLSSR